MISRWYSQVECDKIGATQTAGTARATPNHAAYEEARMAPINFTQNNLAHFWSQVNKTDKCWLWTAKRFRSGYGSCSFSGVRHYSHRVSWEIHYGVIPTGLLVCHTCDVPDCVNPGHLFLGTPRDNMIDRDRKGRGKWREHFRAWNDQQKKLAAERNAVQGPRQIARPRLSAETVSAIVADDLAGMRLKDICAKYKVGHDSVSRFRRMARQSCMRYRAVSR